MIHTNFYQIIDKELDAILVKYSKDALIQKHRNAKEQQKSYALLIWFLEFYGKIINYVPYITDGDKDSSCDIIFDNYDSMGNKVFYIVQSKWNSEKNSQKESDKGDILKALHDFETLLRGEKKEVNEKLSQNLAEFYTHIKQNGEVKFIFLSLSKHNSSADENIQSFVQHQARTKLEIIDIERLKVDYIDRHYKKISPINPLENYYNPEEGKITLSIEKLAQQNGNYFKIEKPFEAYMLLLRPKTIHDLFAKYGFLLFYKNVRNPLIESQFNTEIEKTAIEEPAYFWYYNNGITAITYYLPTIRNQAEEIELTGLQIINGAQTVYSIYKAYKEASPAKRQRMDSEMMITLRLLKSGGEKFDLNVTRYTNSQNPVNERDFCANDEIQKQLQLASFQTKYWYEKRRGEFREVPEGVEVVSNEVFANAYTAIFLQDPILAFQNFHQLTVTGKNLYFISSQENKEGLYEKVFHANVTFEEMLAAFYITRLHEKYPPIYQKTIQNQTALITSMALSKLILEKYFKIKYGVKEINMARKIIDLYEKGEESVFKSAITHAFIISNKYWGREQKETDNEYSNRLMQMMTQPIQYEMLKHNVEEWDFSIEEFENPEDPLQL